MLGATQADMGAALGISQPAVSQRLASAGINALKDAHDVMREERS
jgi:predicted transcriptional regulator